MTKSPLRQRLAAIALVAASLVFSLALMEGMLRVAMPGWRDYHSGRFMTNISVPGYSDVVIGRPGFDGFFAQNNGDFRSHIRINEFGLRDDEPVAAAQGRLWVIGDSFSFGWGVDRDKSYTQVIAERTGVPTYNVAGPGTNICSWQSLYARMPSGLRPSAVVVGLTIENRVGLYDCPESARQAAIQNQAPPADEKLTMLDVKMFMTRHLAIYNFFAVSLKRVNLAEVALEKLGVVNDAQAPALHGKDPAQAPEMIRTSADELKRLKDMVPAGVPYVVALFPARMELREGDAYYRALRTGMEQALQARGIDTIDMLDDFRKAGYRPTHFAHDGHWTELGHQVAGAAIARWMDEHGLTAQLKQGASK